jgi:hypothetical protein
VSESSSQHGGVGDGIERREPVERAAEREAGGDREHEPDGEAPGEEPRALVHDEREDVAALGAERHADADLLRAPADAERDHGVEPDAGEQQRDRTGHGQHRAREPAREEGRAELVGERLRLRGRHVGRDPAHERAQRRRHRRRRLARAHEQREVVIAVVIPGQVGERPGRLGNALIAGVARDADDRAPRAGVALEAQALADRLLAGK